MRRVDLASGAHSVAFTGRINHRALGTGTYVMTLTAHNDTGDFDAEALTFVVVR